MLLKDEEKEQCIEDMLHADRKLNKRWFWFLMILLASF